MNDIEYPITVSNIKVNGDLGIKAKSLFSPEPGTWVSVRPCDDKCKGKTHLGIYIGAIPLSLSVTIDKLSGGSEITIEPSMHNPAIWVPDLKRVVMGCGSWWAVIKSPEELKTITDSDIENCWYVKALKAHLAEEAKKTKNEKAKDLVKQMLESDIEVPVKKSNRGKAKRKGT